MPRLKKDRPSPSTIEVSIFGPGIGECCLLHLGDGEWFVVDSCTDEDDRPVALSYLEGLGVDVAEAVRGILVTHWHDDHISGVADLLEAAKSAKFYCPAAFDSDKLLQLILLQRGVRTEESGGTEELDQVFQILKERSPKNHRKIGLGPQPVKANELLFHDEFESVPVVLKALSPSAEDINRARQAFAEHLPQFRDAKRRAVKFHPNHASAVLRLTVGEHAILLGGDREVTDNPNTGWSIILDAEVGPRKAAFAYKVPHHGSPNGDRNEIWEELLLPSPICAVTPYSPSRLPSEEDIQRLKRRTENVYLTAPRRGPEPPRGERTVDKMMRITAPDRRRLKSRMGHIRIRFDATDAHTEPEVSLGGSAFAC